jgi:hypothetical protein
MVVFSFGFFIYIELNCKLVKKKYDSGFLKINFIEKSFKTFVFCKTLVKFDENMI